MNEKGNFLAMVLLALIALTAILVLVQRAPVPAISDSNSESKMESTTETASLRTMRLGLQEYTKTGYSDKSPVWVCNSLKPPLPNEMALSLPRALKADLNAGFHEIQKEEGLEYSQDFNVQAGLSSGGSLQEQLDKIQLLPDERVDINIEFFHITAEGEDEIKKVDVSDDYSLPYRSWLMYKNYIEWGETYLNRMGREICTELEKTGPCMFSRCASGSKKIIISDSEILKNFDLTKANIEKYVKKQLNYLNSIMGPDGFECEYVLTKKEKEVSIKRQQKCGCGVIENRTQKANAKGCGTYFPSWYPNCPKRSALTPPVLPPFGDPAQKLTSCGRTKHEAASANARVDLGFDFICKDKKRSVSEKEEVAPSTARISVAVAISRSCVPVFMKPIPPPPPKPRPKPGPKPPQPEPPKPEPPKPKPPAPKPKPPKPWKPKPKPKPPKPKPPPKPPI